VFRSYPLAGALQEAFLALEPTAPLAMIWYVNSKTGRDANDGRTSGTAFQTVAQGLTAAKTGDTILIAPGVYDQDLSVQVSAARTANIVVSVAGSE
jgi:Protein of unknown function (DUF1565)